MTQTHMNMSHCAFIVYNELPIQPIDTHYHGYSYKNCPRKYHAKTLITMTYLLARSDEINIMYQDTRADRHATFNTERSTPYSYLFRCLEFITIELVSV